MMWAGTVGCARYSGRARASGRARFGGWATGDLKGLAFFPRVTCFLPPSELGKRTKGSDQRFDARLGGKQWEWLKVQWGDLDELPARSRLLYQLVHCCQLVGRVHAGGRSSVVPGCRLRG